MIPRATIVLLAFLALSACGEEDPLEGCVVESANQTSEPQVSTNLAAGDSGPACALADVGSVRLHGEVLPMGGCPATTGGVEVALFKASSWPPAECVSLPMAEQAACFDGLKSAWTTTSTHPEDVGGAIPSMCSRRLDCPPGWRCDLRSCVPAFGLYELHDVPTGEPLIFRVRTLRTHWVTTWWLSAGVATAFDGAARTDVPVVSQATAALAPAGDGPTALVLGMAIGCGTRGDPIEDAVVELAERYGPVRYIDTGAISPAEGLTATDESGRFLATAPAGENQVSLKLPDGTVQLRTFYAPPGHAVLLTLPGHQPEIIPD